MRSRINGVVGLDSADPPDLCWMAAGHHVRSGTKMSAGWDWGAYAEEEFRGKCGDDAVAGSLSPGCDSAAMPLPGGSARVSRRRRTGAKATASTPSAAQWGLRS